METEDIPSQPVSNWVPETDPLVLGVVGKLGEECSELAGICLRIAIQGVGGCDPETGKANMAALQDEIADVEAMIGCAKEWLRLNRSTIIERRLAKIAYKRPWFSFLRRMRDGGDS